MTERVQKHYDLLKSKEYRKVRRDLDMNVGSVVEGMNLYESDAYMLAFMLEKEEPHLIENDFFGFNRTVKKTPFAEVDGKRIRSGGTGNITPNYARVLSTGMDAACARIKEKMTDCQDERNEWMVYFIGLGIFVRVRARLVCLMGCWFCSQVLLIK